MKDREKKIIVFIVCILSIYLIKTALTPHYLEVVEDRHLYDFDHYQEISKWFLGIDGQETSRQYQYPPLYPILVAPTVSLGIETPECFTYLLFLDNIFITLTFIPLFLLLDKWLSFHNSIGLSFFLCMFNLGFTPKNIGFPIALSTLLFTTFIYFFYNVDSRLRHSSIFYGLLIFTKYVFFFLSPMILVWIYLRHKHSKLITTVFFFTLASLLFSLWSLRNILLHGLSIEGAIGGYSDSFNANAPLNVPTAMIPDKIFSIFTDGISTAIVNCFIIFIFGFLVIVYFYHMKRDIFMKIFNVKKVYHFYIVLMLNFLIFFFVLGMTYRNTIFHWRYLTYLLPVYISLGIMPFLRIIAYRQSRYKKT